MTASVTEGIRISVEVEYQDYFSNPAESHFIFAYHITIENQGSEPVQLLSRKWNIFDSHADMRIVEGEGVVGAQPVIAPGGSYRYESSCNLSSELGKMSGIYRMKKLESAVEFDVTIPEFQLISPVRMN